MTLAQIQSLRNENRSYGDLHLSHGVQRRNARRRRVIKKQLRATGLVAIKFKGAGWVNVADMTLTQLRGIRSVAPSTMPR